MVRERIGEQWIKERKLLLMRKFIKRWKIPNCLLLWESKKHRKYSEKEHMFESKEHSESQCYVNRDPILEELGHGRGKGEWGTFTGLRAAKQTLACWHRRRKKHAQVHFGF